jgi:hypothetical protein
MYHMVQEYPHPKDLGPLYADELARLDTYAHRHGPVAPAAGSVIGPEVLW